MKKIMPSFALSLSVISILFIIFYYNTILQLVKAWSTDDNFSHGFLIPFISGYMIWHKKNELTPQTTSTNNLGLLFITLGTLVHIAGNIGAELFTMRFSMIILIWGMTLYFWGWPITRKITIPIAYLILMIPIPAIIWNQIAFPLQILASKLTTAVVQQFGIPVLREGNILHLANTSLEVVDACSGLRSMTALLGLSGAFSYITFLGILSKWILFFSAIPIAVAVNIIRLTVTALLARYVGPETAQGFLHDMSGLLVFIVAFAFLYAIFLVLSRIETDTDM
jgi:exosortase